MNKKEFIDAVQVILGGTKKDAQQAIKAVFKAIENALVAGEKVQIHGFGTFEVRNRKGRTVYNIQTGGTTQVPASKVPAFKAGECLKGLVKNG